jgi:hypothetical protein
MKTKYRITNHEVAVGGYYYIQIKYWYWPMWITVGTSRRTLEEAEKEVEMHKKQYVVKEIV